MALYCGSRLAIDYDLYKKNVDQLSSYVQSVINDERIGFARRHNVFTAYVVLNLMSCTGHRPVSDPFCNVNDFDFENGFVLINDKVLSPAYRDRVTWMSDAGMSQLSEYITYLKRLAERVQDGKFSVALNGIFDRDIKNKTLLPLFFFLKDDLSGIVNVKKKTLNDVLGEVWPYRWNIFRHILESKLRENEVGVNVINAQLGHHNNNQHPFGVKTSWTAYEVEVTLAAFLDKLSDEQGWKVICAAEMDGQILDCDMELTPREFGHVKRKRILKKRKIEIENKVRGVLDKYFNNEESTRLILSDKVEQDVAKHEIIKNFAESKRLLNYILKTFDRMLSEESFRKNIPLIRSNKPFDDEVSPFTDGWNEKFRAGKAARQKLVWLLKNRRGIRLTKEYLWAEICVTASLYDGLCNKAWLYDVIKLGPAGFKKFKKWNVFFDIHCNRDKNANLLDDVTPDWRWQPGSLTKGLVYGFLEKFGDSRSISLDEHSTRKHINYILNKILPTGGNIRETEKDTLDALVDVSCAFWKYFVPRNFNKVISGEIDCGPLPLNQYGRVIRKIRVETQSKAEFAAPEIEACLPFDSMRSKSGDVSLFKRKISEIFKTAEGTPGGRRQNLLIVESIWGLFEVEEELPSIALYLAMWLISLCNRKTKNGKYLELSSIRTHYYRISSALLNLVRENDILEYDDEELEELYYDVVTYKYLTEKDKKTHAQNCKMRASQIAQFDTFMQDQFGHESEGVDWGYVAGKWLRDIQSKGRVDILTPTEYRHILTFIEKYDGYTDYQRIWIGAFILFGFRFGLRMGEVRRLTIEDVQICGKDIVIQVISSKLGKTKSLSGIRQIPLVGTLDDCERRFLDKILERAREIASSGNKTPLFTSSSDSDALIERQHIWQTIHPLMRHITGSRTVRFHSLRHAYVNGIFAMLFKRYGYKLIDGELEDLWKDEKDSISPLLLNAPENSIDPRRLAALATIVGHADGTTTIKSYIHILDDVIAGYAESAFDCYLTIKELSEIMGVNQSLLERRRRNCRAIVNDGCATLKSIQLDEKIQNIKIRRTNWPLTLHTTLNETRVNLETIDKILEWYGLRNRSYNNLDIILGVDKDKIVEIIEIGKKIEKESMFYHYGLGGHLIDTWLEPDVKVETNKRNFEREAYIHLLQKADNAMEDVDLKESLLRGAGAWKVANSTTDDRHSYILDGPLRLESLVNGLYTLGFGSKDLELSIPSDLTQEQRSKVINKLLRFNIDISTHKGKIRKLERNVADIRKDRVRLSVRRSKNGKIQYNQTLSRVMFVTLVGHEFTKEH